MGWFDDQIRSRKQNDRQDFDKSFMKIAAAVTGDKSALNNTDDAMVQSAVNDIMRYYHIPPREIPSKIRTIEDQLEYVLHPSGVMYRRVELKKGWHRDAYGAMLGFRRPDNAPVALMPFGLTHYRFFDPTKNSYVVINSKNEDDLQESEYCIPECRYGRKSKNQAMIQCDNCSLWYHKNCLDISDEYFQKYNGNGKAWFCHRCEESIFDSKKNSEE